LLTISSITLGVAAVLAVAAVVRAWTVARKLERLSESYWELRYEAGQLKARVSRLEVAGGLRDPEPEPTAPQAASTTTFVPLSALKK
jgi:hypothetical protein